MRKRTPSTELPRLGLSPDEFAATSGVGRTKIFAAIKDGSLIARKLGSRTIILTEDGKAFLRALPRVAA